jgi:hypothetical protein
MFAGCNSTSGPSTSTDQITLRDNGDGTARYTAQISGTIVGGALNVSSPDTFLYRKQCIFLQAALNIIIRSTTTPYVPANINLWLAKLGLAQTQVISAALTFYVDHTPRGVPSPVAPPFLSSLRQTGALNVQECQSCIGGDPNVGPTGPSALAGLPGLAGLTKFWNFGSPQGQTSSLIVTGTALSDFRSTVPGLQCSPGFIRIVNNRQLGSLGGLEGLNTTLRPGPTVQIVNNPLLTGPQSVAALKGLAGCLSPARFTPLSSVIQIHTAACVASV